MALTKLGEHLEWIDLRNTQMKYAVDSVRGVSIGKRFIDTKADMNNVSLNPYLLVEPNDFAYVTVTSRNGEKLSIAHNNSRETYLCSSSYVVFRVKEHSALLPSYLRMFFNRPEFDRYARFNSWGSAREVFSWDDLCDTELDLPPQPIQQRYVDIYNSMLANQNAYESSLEELRACCDNLVENLKRTLMAKEIGPYIEPLYEVDTEGKLPRRGVSTKKRFVTPKQGQNVARSSQVVRLGQFAYNTATTRNADTLSIALCSESAYSVPGIYQVFGISKPDELCAEYLFMWFCRPEFDRYARFASYGSAHEQFLFADMREVAIPIPDIELQYAIANIFKALVFRRELQEEIGRLHKRLCPILIAGALEEAKRLGA
jgi:type I restriction enzyme S subunit